MFAVSAQARRAPICTIVSEFEEGIWQPLLYLKIGYDITKRWWIWAEADFWRQGSEAFVDGLLMARYRFNRHWDIGLGFRRIDHQLETDEVRNRTERDQAALQFGYTF